MGAVFLATDTSGREVALKIIRPDLSMDTEFRRRFEREVRAVRRVSGRCTAKLVDADIEIATPWLATEFVDGPTLGEYVRSHEPFRGASFTALAIGLLEALEAIHHAGVIHRDLTPNNVLIAQSGPRVVDFGIAQHIDSSSTATATGTTLGTPAWMSPEQAEGKVISTATDVFAWGAVIAFAGLGRAPFGEGRPQAVVYRIVHSPPDLEGLSEPAAAIIASCLSKEPEKRPTISEIASVIAPAASDDLTEAAEHTLRDHWQVATVQLRRPTSSKRRRRWRRVATLVALPIALAAVGLALVASLGGDPDSNQTRSPPSTAATAASVPVTTTAVPPTTPSPEAAWVQLVSTLPLGSVSSPVAVVNGVPVAMSAQDVSGQLWEFQQNAWVMSEPIALELPVAGDPIVASDVTNDELADFVITLAGASRPLGSVVSNAPGTWRVIPFETPDGFTAAENLNIQGGNLIGYVNTCDPNCAEGELAVTLWTYEPAGAYFVPA